MTDHDILEQIRRARWHLDRAQRILDDLTDRLLNPAPATRAPIYSGIDETTAPDYG